MRRLQEIAETTERSREDLRKRKTKENSRLNTEEQKEIRAIQKKIDAIKERYAQEKQKRDEEYKIEGQEIQEAYERKSAGEMFQSLKESYQILQNRSGLIDLSVEDLETGARAYKALQEVQNETTRAILLDSMSERVREVVSVISSNENGVYTPETVYSFISHNSQECIILSPVDGENTNKQLARDLEEKLLSVLELEEIVQNQKLTDLNLGRPEKITFNANPDLVNGYFACKISTQQNPEVLAKLLEQKLGRDEIQPESFGKARVYHKVVPIDNQIVQYFLNHNPEELVSSKDLIESMEAEGQMRISLETAAEIAGVSLMGLKRMVTMGKIQGENDEIYIDSLKQYIENKNKIKTPKLVQEGGEQYQKQNRTRNNHRPSVTKEQALENLASLTESEIDYTLAAECIGVTEHAVYMMKHNERISVGSDKTISVDELTKYVSQRRPTGQGWRLEK